ncbi:MAG: hypothetical protein NZM15_01975 [Flavobacteriales bacterium]|nr:hypothetical protein [Flavobacteriales bacterium]MDW8431452.1 hypothetical protein [Flavobacteriales bacterium]
MVSRRVPWLQSARSIDYLNIGLIVLSLLVALRLPFELFLFSYAVLGPLHYLTEINWLRERQFFSPGRRDALWLTALTLLIFLSFLSTEFLRASSSDPHPFLRRYPELLSAARFLEQSGSAFVFSALMVSLVFVLIPPGRGRLLWILPILAVALALRHQVWYAMLFGMFVPTLVHVGVFTGLFMLYGAVKNRSLPGFLSVGALILAVLIILNLSPKVFAGRELGGATLQSYFSSKFQYLNLALFQLLAPAHKVRQYLQEHMPWAFLNTVYGWRIQTLIAFAYTYHYLNWFSKTGIIRWHQVPRPRLAAAFFIWVVAVVLYFYNYYWGLVALFFLSMLHVFLEFPLNIQSARGLLRAAARRQAPTTP